MAAPVFPITFPLEIQSDEPDCATESARKLADRIKEVHYWLSLLFGLPLDTNITGPLNLGAGLLGTRNQDSRYVDNSHFTLDADQVMTLGPTPGFVVHDNPSAISVDLGLSGPAINARDQAAAFPVNSLVHLYWIYNGTTLAGLVSLAAPYPGAGPVLPAGYSRGAYAGATLLDASGFLVPSNIRGRWTCFKAARQVETGASTYGTGALQAISVASCVPANAEAIRAQVTQTVAGTTTQATFTTTLFDGLEDEVGSVSGRSNVSGDASDTGVFDSPQYAQLLKVTVPAGSGDATPTAVVKVLAFRNPNDG